jgi:hypothetical protein
MTVFVDDATVHAARDRAAQLALTEAETQRWRDVTAYVDARKPDPTPERAAVLRDLLGMPGATDGEVMRAAGRLLGDTVTGADSRAEQVRVACLRWFEEDFTEAAPLLELFTGHHRDPEGGPPPADPAQIGRAHF